MKLEITNYDNAAVQDDVPWAIATALRTVANRVERGDTAGSIMDVNGNKIGSWSMPESWELED
jgi:hypothetical protein